MCGGLKKGNVSLKDIAGRRCTLCLLWSNCVKQWNRLLFDRGFQQTEARGLCSWAEIGELARVSWPLDLLLAELYEDRAVRRLLLTQATQLSASWGRATQLPGTAYSYYHLSTTHRYQFANQFCTHLTTRIISSYKKKKQIKITEFAIVMAFAKTGPTYP